ncbi:MAG: L-threonylcarbamoyladenylate synthase [Ahrensia sp.]
MDTIPPCTIAPIADADARARALDLWAQGVPVAVPTETVYGLAADATNGVAVARIFDIKQRPAFNPLICHVSSMAMAEEFAVFDPLARALADRFWPGPLTLILPLRKNHSIHPLVTAGLDTVGVRMPDGRARDLIEAFGKPLAAPSANRSGGISPTTAQAVVESLGGALPMVLDGGPCPVGLESTIVKTDGESAWLLRPGGVPADAIEQHLGKALSHAKTEGGVQAPGQLQSHYAPNAGVRLNVAQVREGEALLAFGPTRVNNAAHAAAIANLSESGDMQQAAANLYTMLSQLDRSGAATIAVEPVPSQGLGVAINDRLRRAAAPRPTLVENKAQ